MSTVDDVLATSLTNDATRDGQCGRVSVDG